MRGREIGPAARLIAKPLFLAFSPQAGRRDHADAGRAKSNRATRNRRVPKPHDPARIHPQMEARRADRARDRAGAFSRSLPSARTPAPGGGRPDRRAFHFREGRLQDRRRRRLRRRVEEGLLRLGIQEEEARSRQGAGAAHPLRRGAGEPAAARRLRHPSLSRRDALDQRGSGPIRIRARRPRRAGESRDPASGFLRSGQAALGAPS